MNERQYIQQYRGILSTVFEARKAFSGAFAPLQTLDGIQHNAKAFSVKTNATPVVIGDYDKGENVAFGTGTANSSRFGKMTEVIYQDTDVPYAFDLVIHEGLDRHTVNNDLNAALADRFKLQSEAQTRYFNTRNGKFLADNAGKAVVLAKYADEEIKKLFNELDAYYTDNEVNADVVVYLRSEFYSAIVDMAQNTHAKGSSVSLDSNGLAKYKDFRLEKTPAKYFPKDVVAIFSPNAIAIPFVGIETARTIEATNFDGVELQAAAKGGEYIVDENKKAVVKVTMASV